MTKVAVYNQTGEKISEMDLNPKVFELEKLDLGLVHQAVITQLANARYPVAHTKMRGEVSGSGKKPWRQKGTGRARAGSIRSPLWRGGGITFGPRSSRNFSLKMNRSAFHKAIFTVLAGKIHDNKLIVTENLSPISKSKEFVASLGSIAHKAGLGKKYAVIIPEPNKELIRAARNLPNAKVLLADQLNVVDLIKYDLIIFKDALPLIEKTYAQ